MCPLLFVQCIDQYEVDVPPGYTSRLAIDGLASYTDEFSQVSVAVTRLFDFTAAGAKPAVLKRVDLMQGDRNAQRLDKLSDSKFGIIEVPNALDFSPGNGEFFHVRVETHEGILYESTPEPLMHTPPILGLTVDTILREIIHPITGFARVPYLQFKLDTDVTSPYILWKVRFTGFLTPAITLDLSEVVLFGDEDLRSSALREHVIYEKRLDNFPNGYGIEVEQFSLSPTAHDYWRQVLETINRTGNQFEAAPGIVRGNISNLSDPEDEVYGYFYASQRQLRYLYIAPASQK
ncbi:MAG: DUF4249 domain-containing protein [Saprospiraceae bacterium]|nr:DUF4249 domain-containing protein [Saprospiraceae bacterium]